MAIPIYRVLPYPVIGGQVGVILKPTRKPGNSCFVAGVQYTLTGEYCTPHPMYVEIDSWQGCSIP